VILTLALILTLTLFLTQTTNPISRLHQPSRRTFGGRLSPASWESGDERGPSVWRVSLEPLVGLTERSRLLAAGDKSTSGRAAGDGCCIGSVWFSCMACSGTAVSHGQRGCEWLTELSDPGTLQLRMGAATCGGLATHIALPP